MVQVLAKLLILFAQVPHLLTDALSLLSSHSLGLCRLPLRFLNVSLGSGLRLSHSPRLPLRRTLLSVLFVVLFVVRVAGFRWIHGSIWMFSPQVGHWNSARRSWR
jgi:hypothetical protein